MRFICFVVFFTMANYSLASSSNVDKFISKALAVHLKIKKLTDLLDKIHDDNINYFCPYEEQELVDLVKTARGLIENGADLAVAVSRTEKLGSLEAAFYYPGFLEFLVRLCFSIEDTFLCKDKKTYTDFLRLKILDFLNLIYYKCTLLKCFDDAHRFLSEHKIFHTFASSEDSLDFAAVKRKIENEVFGFLLHGAASQNKPKVIKEFIRRRIKVTFTNRGETPLMAASKCGHMEVVEVLLQYGYLVAGIDSEGPYHNTALSFAAGEGNSKVVALLLRAGADAKKINHYKNTPLDRAILSGHAEAARELVEHSFEQKNNKVISSEEFNKYIGNGLLLAISMKNEAITDMFFRFGADINFRNKKGETPLIVASIVNDYKFVKWLLPRLKNISESSASREISFKKEINLALGYASFYGRCEIVSILVKSGAEVNFQDGLGATPLMNASTGGHVNTVELLLGLRADVNLRDKFGKSALNCADSAPKVAEILVKAGGVKNTSPLVCCKIKTPDGYIFGFSHTENL